MPFFIPDYESLRIHELMLSDKVRTETFGRAIERNVEEGDIVVDVGTGTGVLALFAVRAGARKVYAIEPTGIIDLARKIAKRNGLDEKIEFLKGKVEEIEIPEKADCIVSEWLGVFAIQENMLPSVAIARDRFLKTGGKMLPERVTLFLSLVEDEEIFEEKITRWIERPYGLDYTDFAICQAHDVHLATLKRENLLSEAIPIITIDMNSRVRSDFEIEERYTVKREGTCHGLGGWFRADFPGDIALDTSPGQPLTEWAQAFFPILEPVKVKRGDEVIVKFIAKADNGIVHFTREVSFPKTSGKPSFIGDTRKVKFRD